MKTSSLLHFNYVLIKCHNDSHLKYSFLTQPHCKCSAYALQSIEKDISIVAFSSQTHKIAFEIECTAAGHKPEALDRDTACGSSRGTNKLSLSLCLVTKLHQRLFQFNKKIPNRNNKKVQLCGRTMGHSVVLMQVLPLASVHSLLTTSIKQRCFSEYQSGFSWNLKQPMTDIYLTSNFAACPFETLTDRTSKRLYVLGSMQFQMHIHVFLAIKLSNL